MLENIYNAKQGKNRENEEQKDIKLWGKIIKI